MLPSPVGSVVVSWIESIVELSVGPIWERKYTTLLDQF